MNLRVLLPLFLLGMAGTGVYLNTLDGEWVWDDASSVLLHRHVQDPASFFQLFKEDQHAFGRGQGNFYRPLVSASFMLDYWLSGGPRPDPDHYTPPLDLSPLWFHLSNIIWHVLAGCLFYLLLLRLGAPEVLAFLTALIYLVHPLHTEAVAYISGRADMMSAAFMYAGLLTGVVAVTRSSWFYAGFTPLFFTLALLSKESSFIFPILWLFLLVFVYFDKKGNDDHGNTPFRLFSPHAVIITGAVAGILICYGFLRSTVLRFAESGVGGPGKALGMRLLETGQSFFLYLGLLFHPVGLHMERSLDGVPMFYGVIGWFFVLIIVISIILGWMRHWYLPVVGMLWFLAAWLPISGIFPLNAPMAEHWMYVPMAGFWLALVATLWLLCRYRWVKASLFIITGIFSVYLGFLTIERNHVWRDNETLFRDTLAKNPYSIRVHYNLAVTYEDLKRNWAGARRHYNRVLALQSIAGSGSGGVPEMELRLALAGVCEKMGRFAEATGHYAVLAARKETLLPGMQGLARCLVALGDGGSAVRLRDELLKASGNRPEAVVWLDRLLAGEVFSQGICFFDQ
ncbi:MAG TPA: tetratricopeptide repeat protein [Candidatus Hydrogenedentes bacterium]|nr:tetratricopeptide repeat protein [Candidatus Hydrogenedentota bacterium]